MKGVSLQYIIYCMNVEHEVNFRKLFLMYSIYTLCNTQIRCILRTSNIRILKDLKKSSLEFKYNCLRHYMYVFHYDYKTKKMLILYNDILFVIMILEILFQRTCAIMHSLLFFYIKILERDI